MANKFNKTASGMMAFLAALSRAQGKMEKVLPSPLIYPAQKTRWLCTNVKRHKLSLCYVRTVTKRRNKQPLLCTHRTSTWNLRRCGLKETPTTVCASVLCRNLFYKWQHPAQVHPHASAISIAMCSVFDCWTASSGCTVCLLHLNLRGIVSPHLGERVAHLKSQWCKSMLLHFSTLALSIVPPMD